ncbi:MAG TPA: DivIVA domain-containing protein [Candidatus Tumulicola sp.]|nr:DivIVA domain-containing protein [Candidatus Tumulicola sp.]
MKITPVDIQHKQFKKSLQGYAREEVDAYLDDVIESLEHEIEERTKLEASVAELKEKLAHFIAMDESLRNTLVLAQRTADEVKASAHKEVDLIKQRGKIDLDQELADMRRRIADAKNEMQRVLDQTALVKQDLKAFLARHQALVEEAGISHDGATDHLLPRLPIDSENAAEASEAAD